ncbi:hypothetical protein PV10_08143 [Exophiala mesophila]|uniref:Uncharacterized protein n=1 Tax=Exophiala mesophila TaxID=212818 RepID=A0A0D1WI26_EXOME|nr:uncharacterized protein PV10_08143 [Exophiala mesophila]KIV88460.1 hypothetical protein PV10_08143 [Exophiala mesophila]
MLNLYTETAFQVTPPTSASLVEFHIPRKNGSLDKARSPSKRHHTKSPNWPQDEATFSSRHLASESSIYFRKSKTYPRVFLWSILRRSRALQVQCADLARSESDRKEAYFTLQFEFQDDIVPRAVAFADSENGDDLHAFVATTRNELFNLIIHPTAFRDPSILQSSPQPTWVKILDSSALRLHTVHHLHAANPLEIFASFTNGRLQRLKRRAGEDHWSEDNYDEKTWGESLRGIVTWRGVQTIPHASSNVDVRTVQSMILSSDGIHLFTICLNHSIRVWHLPSGRLVATKDLLDQEREPNDRTHLNPADDAHLQIVKLPLQRYPVLLTYSPQDGGQFKFWDIKGSLTDNIIIEDKYPGTKLTAPDPDPSGNTLWSMVGVKLDAGNDVLPARVWALYRNHNYHQLYNCQFEFRTLTSSWKSHWVKCAPTASSKALAPDLIRTDSQDPASKWIDFLFYPGRYTEAVLQTALSIYEDANNKQLPTSSHSNTPLTQRMVSVVASNVSLRKYGDSDLDFDRFLSDTDAQWRNLYRIVDKINDATTAPLSLAYDSFIDMVWIPMTGRLCAVRECNNIELLQNNQIDDLAELEDVAARVWPHRRLATDGGDSFSDFGILITAARAFSASLTPELSENLDGAIREFLYTNSESLISTKVVDIFDSVGFSEAVSDELFTRLENDLQPLNGCTGLTNELFLVLLENFPRSTRIAKSGLRTTLFGNLLLSNGMLDVLESEHLLLKDLLILAIFVEGEFNQDDDKIPDFDASELFSYITPQLKVVERNLWLATHNRRIPLEILGHDARPNIARKPIDTSLENTRLVSIFEDTLSKAIRPTPPVEMPMTSLLTTQLDEIEDWASGKQNKTDIDSRDDHETVYLQCDLLAQKEFDLATEFSLFQPSTPWSSYIKGRLALGMEHYDVAANHFRAASYGLSHGKAIGNLVELSAGLLSLIDAEHFYNGLPSFLYHVATLFETASSYNEAGQFFRLALEALSVGQPESSSSFRSDLLSRLFNAELKQARYASAYDALAQLPDKALQRVSVVALINSMLDAKSWTGGPAGAVKQIQSLPWAINPHLAHQLDLHLLSLAKKQTSTSISSTDWLSTPGDTDYLSIIHAVRIGQKDYRGAVAVLFDRLRLVRKSGRARHDPKATALRHVLLALINAMACVDPEEAYVLADVEEKTSSGGPHQKGGTIQSMESTAGRKRRRVIVTLEDLRKEYQQVLDKCSRIERGDFDFDVDGEGDDEDDVPIDQSRLNLSSHVAGGDVMEM